MRVSLNEIDAQIRKAARGAGLPWGLAEEAGVAARWLAARGLPGLDAMASVLEAHLQRPCGTRCDIEGGAGSWRGRCPIAAGAALTDALDQHAPGDLTFDGIENPVLLAPYAAQAAGALGCGVRLQWGDAAITVSVAGYAACPPDTAAEAAPGRVICRLWPDAPPATPPSRGAEVTRALWDRLEALAARTYVPASDVSRQQGAGAGHIETD